MTMLGKHLNENEVTPVFERCECCNGKGKTVSGLRPGYIRVSPSLLDEVRGMLDANNYYSYKVIYNPATNLEWLEIGKMQASRISDEDIVDSMFDESGK